MKYTFVDGMGNEYKLDNYSLAYNPMKAEMSSSGTYSGGEPFTIELGKTDLIKLIDVCERALWSKKDHTDKRTMGSGILIKKVGEESIRIYLSFRSSSLNELGDVFRDVKEANQ